MSEDDDTNVVNFNLAKLMRTPSPWETKAEANANLLSVRQALNESILDRVRGIAPMQADEAANDDPQYPFAPGDPNVR